MTRALAILAFWTLIGLGSALQVHVGEATYGRGVSVGLSLLRTMPVWLFWAPVTPIVAWLARRFRLERGRRAAAIAVHLAAAAAASSLHTLFLTWFFRAAALVRNVDEPIGEMLKMMFVSRLYLDLLTYVAILGVVYAIEYHDRFRERDVRASRLESQLTRARLDALRMQLNPHFLFNALNAVASEVRVRRNDEAITMLVGLSDLLRYALDADEESRVPLWKEIAFLERYVDIERARFADRLRVEIEVSPELREVLVPPLLLQPLVENAIRHGIAPRDAPGSVEVGAHALGDSIVFTVRDDGVGLRADAGGGIGVANVRERLSELYGDRQRIDLRDRAGGGVEVTVVIPREEAAA